MDITHKKKVNMSKILTVSRKSHHTIVTLFIHSIIQTLVPKKCNNERWDGNGFIGT